MFSREVILELQPLDAQNFQSLLNYSSSRVRACTTSLVVHMSLMDPEDVEAMTVAIANEIGTSDCLTGIGFMLHGDSLYAPSSLRALTPLMVQGRLTDFEALKRAVSGEVSGDDGLLRYYAGNWWTHFSRNKAPFPQGAVDIIRFWRQQKPNLPPPLTFPPLDHLNANGLATLELHQAYAVGNDVVTRLEKDIERCLQHTKALARSIKASEDLRNRLHEMEESELAIAARREMSAAIHKGGNEL